MNLLQIKYFLEVSKTLNFTNAAQNLFVSQPAFSRQIQALEEELGVKLLFRNNRKVVLTEAGKVFQNRFEKIVNEIEESLEEVKSKTAHQDFVRIGVLQVITSELIDNLLEKLCEFFSPEKIQIYRYRFDELKEAFEKDKIDIVISLGGFLSERSEIEHYTLERISAGIICSKEMKFNQKKKEVLYQELKNKKLICVEKELDPEFGKYQEMILHKLQITSEQVIYTGDVINTILHLHKKDGYSIFYKNPDLLESEKIQFIPIEDESIYFKIMISWKREKKFPIKEVFG